MATFPFMAMKWAMLISAVLQGATCDCRLGRAGDRAPSKGPSRLAVRRKRGHMGKKNAAYRAAVSHKEIRLVARYLAASLQRRNALREQCRFARPMSMKNNLTIGGNFSEGNAKPIPLGMAWTTVGMPDIFSCARNYRDSITDNRGDRIILR